MRHHLRRTLALLALVPVLAAQGAGAAKVSIGLIKLTSNAPIFVGIEKGFFKDEGIELDVRYFTAAAPIATAVAAGQLDVGAGGVTAAFFNTAAAGLGMKLVFDKGFFKSGFNTSALIVSPKLTGVRRIADLKGRTVGVTQVGSTFHYMLGRILAQNGLSLDDIKVVPVGTVAALGETVSSGRVDAVIAPQPQAGQILAGNQGRLIGWVDERINYQVAAVFYARRFINDRATALAFSRAYLRSVRYYTDAALGKTKGKNYDEVVSIIAEAIEAPKNLVEDGLYWMDRDGRLSTASIADQIGWYKANGFLSPGAKLSLSDVIDTSFQREAVQALR